MERKITTALIVRQKVPSEVVYNDKTDRGGELQIVTLSNIQSYLLKPQQQPHLTSHFIKLAVLLIGFLFAQAILFGAAVPLFVPFYIASAIYEKKYKQFMLAGGLLGALSLGVGQLMLVVLQIFIYSFIRKKLIKQSVFLALLLATVAVQLIWQSIFYSFEIPLIVILYMLFEIAATVIAFIFLKQALVKPEKLLIDWRYERIVSVIILFSFLLIALNGKQFLNIAPATLLLQFVICCAAFYGPLPFAAFVATTASVVLSMSQLSFSAMIALYAVTGALVSNVKALGKYGVATVSIVPSIVFLLYDATLPLDVVHFTSITLGALLFVQFASFVKPTKKESRQRIGIAESAMDDLKRFNIFLSEMMELTASQNLQQQIECNHFTTCQQCYRYERCWSQLDMEGRLKDLLYARQYANEGKQMKAEQAVKELCIRSVPFLQEFQHRIIQFQIMKQQHYSRKLIGQQLKQMGQHFERLMDQLHHNIIEQGQLEERLRQHLGEYCLQVKVEKKYFGHVKGWLYVTDELSDKMLQQQLETFFCEPVDVHKELAEKGAIPAVQYRFRSAIRFEMEYDIYNKTSATISGDLAVITEVERGIQTLLVADGMGTGRIAREQSQQLLYLLRQCLQYQLSPELILLSLQYLLNPLVQDSYATLDLLVYDLKNAQLYIWKTGSTATYIVRGEQLLTIESSSAPIGTIQQVTNVEKVQLFAGDYVFVLTDGLFEGELYEEQQQFLQQQLLHYCQYDWALATILYEVMEKFKCRYHVQDDVTFIVTKIDHVQHQWTAVKYDKKKVSK